MRKRLTMRLGAAGIGALVVLALAAPPAYGLVRSAEPGSARRADRASSRPAPTCRPSAAISATSTTPGLTQIDKSNLEQLAPTWRTHVSAVAPASDDVGQQTTPIVVDGVIYLDTPSGGVIAVDGATGDPIWKWENQVYGLSGTRRGVSAGDGRIYTLAGGNRVVALDQATGEEVWAVQPTGPERRGPRTRRKGRDGVLRRDRLRPRGRRRPRGGRRARRERRIVPVALLRRTEARPAVHRASTA